MSPLFVLNSYNARCSSKKSFRSTNSFIFPSEHQSAFEPFVIVHMRPSVCPQCKKMGLKTIQSLLNKGLVSRSQTFRLTAKGLECMVAFIGQGPAHEAV